MSGESLNPDLDYAIKDHKILPMIVIDLCRLDFHLGRGICADRGGKNPGFQQKVDNDLLFGCLCNKLLPQLTS